MMNLLVRAPRTARPGIPRTACLPRARALAAIAFSLAQALTPPAAASTFRPILVDGEFSDWTSIESLHADAPGDHGGAPVDLGRVYVANDERFVYLRFETGALVNLQSLPATLFVFLDTDHSLATGFATRGIGSDLVIEFSGGGLGIRFWEQVSGSFYGAWLNPALLDAYVAPTVAATEFELRLRRDARLPIRDAPAFPGATFRLALEAQDSNGQPKDLAPEAAGGLPYAIATGSPAPPPDNRLGRHQARHLRLLSYNVRFDGLIGADSARFTRVLRALAPDVVGFQELFDTSPGVVAARLDRDLPLPAPARWQAFKGARGQVTASRFPATHDAGAPALELAVRVSLPRETYATDLYLINSHFKCCGSIGSSEDRQRQAAADALVAWLRDLRTAGGAELPPGTPIVQLGDLNLVGGPQPLRTLLTGDIVDEAAHGPDSPPDWDGSALARDDAIHSDGRATYTWRSDGSSFLPGKLDYVLWTDAVAGPGNRFILNTLDMTPEKLAALGLRADDTAAASDHLPLVVDLDPGRPGPPPPNPGDPPVKVAGWPNPFRDAATIEVALLRADALVVSIHDVGGTLVRVLARDPGPTSHATLVWRGDDAEGRPVRSGIYYAVARGAGGIGARRLVLLR